jgi:hypothetical protein
VVDLTFTGTRAFVLKGSYGSCRKATDTKGGTFWEVLLTSADAPQIGQSFSLSAPSGPTYVDLKWVPDSSGGYTRPPTGGTWQIADGKSYTVDSTLSELKPPNGPGPGPEQLKGTAACL